MLRDFNPASSSRVSTAAAAAGKLTDGANHVLTQSGTHHK
jgi:hypothetical protein